MKYEVSFSQNSVEIVLLQIFWEEGWEYFFILLFFFQTVCLFFLCLNFSPPHITVCVYIYIFFPYVVPILWHIIYHYILDHYIYYIFMYYTSYILVKILRVLLLITPFKAKDYVSNLGVFSQFIQMHGIWRLSSKFVVWAYTVALSH